MTLAATSSIPLDLGGLRVAITAGAGGIGRVMADSFANCGAHPFVSDVDDAALASCGHPGMHANAGIVRDLDRFIDAAASHLGGLDVLVNNAGIAVLRLISAMTTADWQLQNSVNLDSVFHGTRRAVALMRKIGEGGSIINISSTVGLVGVPACSAYAAAKGGVRLFSKSVAV